VQNDKELRSSTVRNALLLFVCLLSGCAATKPQTKPEDEFTAGYREGEYNEHNTPDGAAYVKRLARWLGPALTQSRADCGVAGRRTPPVDWAIELNVDGSVRKAFIRPSSPIWDCMKMELAKKIFPAPPRDGFWTSGEID
jgi:hypothetical protein